jgi:hypothetical protein
VTPLVDGQDAIVGRHRGDEIVPEVGLVPMAVEQDQGDAFGAPLEDVEVEVVRPPKT